jgi:hypothetical protein
MLSVRTIALAVFFCLSPLAAPAGDGIWTESEYLDLFFRHYNGHAPLPHLRNTVQKALFDHLIDPGNITRITSSSAAPEQKLNELRMILALLGAFRAEYNTAVIVGEPLEQELTLVQAYTLSVAAAAAGMMRTAHDDGAGTSSWTTMLEGMIQSVGERERYTPAQSIVLAKALTLNYPEIARVLPPRDRERLIREARKLRLDDGQPQLTEAIVRMTDALNGSP